ncbi:amidohydrolase [Rhodococcus sp. ABRD24]|uniref:amidohydrolase n=1 Tax=Rhodococcus sp. ABRD24 TaxID=2507582 RepID=UPI0010389EBF|nr:amidohydrolase [Rhodococcus sp. ABRD24]QBJ95586.1 amidohydrolase [Rhodococcus sp. ABRD24]
MPSEMSSETLVRATVRTMAPDNPVATGLLCRNDRIVAVGDWQELRESARPATEFLDLRGATVLPGFTDSHNHMLWTGMQARKLDLSGAASIAEIGTRLRRYADEHPDLPWITSSEGWFIEDLRERRMPNRYELDEYCSNIPVYLPRLGHTASVNSRALEVARIHADSPNVEGGHIVRAPDGTPTGELQESPAMSLVARMVPDPSVGELLGALRDVQRDYHAKGITGVIDPALTSHELSAYRAARDSNDLTIRTTMMPVLDPALPDEQVADWLAGLGGPTGSGDSRLKMGAIKVFLDGIVSMRTAWVRDAYPGTCDHGTRVVSAHRLDHVARECALAGWSLGIHAIGGQAIDAALKALTAAAEGTRLSELRCSLIHAYLGPTDDDMRAAAALRMGLAAQPQMHTWIAPQLTQMWGRAVADAATPLRSWLNAGVVVAGGSDSPLTPADPLAGIGDAVTRRMADGDVAGADQSVDVNTALKMYTTDAAWLAFSDHERGVLRPGMLADWIAVDKDPLTTNPEDLAAIEVLETRIGNCSVTER